MVICLRQKRKKPKLSLYMNGSDVECVTKHNILLVVMKILMYML